MSSKNGASKHQRTFEPIGAVHAPVEHLRHMRIVCEGAAVAVKIFIGLVVIILLDAHHDAVAYEGMGPAGVRVIRRTHPCKR